MAAKTFVYKISVTNFEFTLGLTENIDYKGNKINEYFLPKTLRVEDKSVETSSDGEIIDFIFMKDASVSKYKTLLAKDDNKTIPQNIKNLIDNGFYYN